ncbi:MAG TPA: nucleotidyl transferase AbiEii/AbiGii toxin family protein [Gammaproteobacteria bacterium]|nr:nucleotidyl transferase AbiEii/AbiGii toxin family protein [Gammaproteobacteria bacterium]
MKSGTSLSKCYGIINRFSEDCDLTINKEFIGITEDAEIIASKSRNQRDKSLSTLATAAKNKVNDYLKPLLENKFKLELTNHLGENEWRIESDPTDNDNQTLLFFYPTTLETDKNNYIRSVIKLEFGARGDVIPNESKIISPYIYDALPEVFHSKPAIPVHTLTAKRTFWEKATLLHAEHHRKADKPPKDRMFRHYYDIAMLDMNGVTKQALSDPQLLNTVLMNKKTYFASSSANYETATIGTIHLMPNELFTETLRQDCREMSEMFFQRAPDFDEIMTKVAQIETTINSQ